MVIPVEARPDFLAAADLDNDGIQDLLFSCKGCHSAYLMAGDGAGHFQARQSWGFDGGITALAVGPLERNRAASGIVAAVERVDGPALIVYSAFVKDRSPKKLALYSTGVPTSLTIGDFDGDQYPDIGVVEDGRLVVIHGDPNGLTGIPERLVEIPPFLSVRSVAASGVVYGAGRTQFTVLATDGTVSVCFREKAAAPRYSHTRVDALLRTRRSSPAHMSIGKPGWTQTSTVPGHGASRLVDSEILIGHVVVQAASGVAAILPMRLNAMGGMGLVYVEEGDPTLRILAAQPVVTYHVTGLGDSQTGSCTTPNGSPLSANCTTLRSAVLAANANPGQDLVVFDVNGSITLSVPGQDDTGQAGDLDVTDALTIVGNGTANTIIQAGSSATTGVDKVFSFNPLGLKPGFPVSISGLTIQFGRNTSTDFSVGNDEGGAFDFDAGSQDGAGSLAVANCDILQNSTLNGDGGGIALFDGGTVSITNSNVNGNVANTQDPTTWYGFYGGGIFIGDPGPFPANITIAGSSISNNSLTAANSAGQAQFGGGICSFAWNAAIHNSTVSGNQSNADGGGLYFPNGTATIDQASVLSNNTSGGVGGAAYGAFTIANSAILNNHSAAGGGALYTGWANASIVNSRLVGNSSTTGAPAIDGDTSVGATATVINNWWGSNSSPVAAVNSAVATYTPWLVMTIAATPSSIYSGTTSTLTASIISNSAGTTGFSAPDGTPVTFAGTLGSLAPPSIATTSGSAATTYTAGSTLGNATVSATIDSQLLSTAIAIIPAPAPSLTSISPAIGGRGASIAVTLTGANFFTGATIATNDSGITISNVTVVSTTQITANLTLAANAALGPANVTVTTSGGVSSAVTFTVVPPACPSTMTLDVLIGYGSAGCLRGDKTFSNFIYSYQTTDSSGLTVWTQVPPQSVTVLFADTAGQQNTTVSFVSNWTVSNSNGNLSIQYIVRTPVAKMISSSISITGQVAYDPVNGSGSFIDDAGSISFDGGIVQLPVSLLPDFNSSGSWTLQQSNNVTYPSQSQITVFAAILQAVLPSPAGVAPMISSVTRVDSGVSVQQ